MRDQKPDMSEPVQERYRALSRWDNEGGAGPRGSQPGGIAEDELSAAPPLTEAELVHLRVRVIALENLVIALLHAEMPFPKTVRLLGVSLSSLQTQGGTTVSNVSSISFARWQRTFLPGQASPSIRSRSMRQPI